MSGYFGTETQQRMQRQAEASAAFIAATPGACQTGRTMGCDDPDRLGWERIEAFLERDGVCGFRLIARDKADEIRTRLAARRFRLDTWDVFMAEREAALAASALIIERGLPDGLAEREGPTDPEGPDTRSIQALMSAAGVVPFSGSLLTASGTATTVAVAGSDGGIAAAAHGYMPHNLHSSFHRHAWGGLVAVAPAHRGKGIGAYINARMVVSVFRALGATHIYELVSASNIPSRRMVQACGLRPETTLVCGLAVPDDEGRFTT